MHIQYEYIFKDNWIFLFFGSLIYILPYIYKPSLVLDNLKHYALSSFFTLSKEIIHYLWINNIVMYFNK
jgi:hypothetical protein